MKVGMFVAMRNPFNWHQVKALLSPAGGGFRCEDLRSLGH